MNMYWRKSKQARGSVLKGIARIVITDDATAVVVPHLSIKFLQGCRTSEIDRQMYQNCRNKEHNKKFIPGKIYLSDMSITKCDVQHPK